MQVTPRRQWDLNGHSALLKPIRISSLLEYQQIFGGPYPEKLEVTLSDTQPQISVAIKSIMPAGTFTNFNLFYQLQMFFANGGGICHVVSVGDYSNTTIDKDDLVAGIAKFEEVDEVTLLLATESVALDDADRKFVYDTMIAQCANMQDRFALLDTIHTTNNTVSDDAQDFRDNSVGTNNLKYAASYYPGLKTPLLYYFKDNQVIINDDRGGAGNGPYDDVPNDTLYTISNGYSSYIEITVSATLTSSDIFQNYV